MFSPAFIARLESACVRSLEVLEQVLAEAESDSAKVTAGLGILRLSERLFTKLHRAPSPTEPPEPAPAPSPSPDPTDTAPAAPAADSSDTLDDPGAPLTPAELAELMTAYRLSADQIRNSRTPASWRGLLPYARLYGPKPGASSADPILNANPKAPAPAHPP